MPAQTASIVGLDGCGEPCARHADRELELPSAEEIGRLADLFRLLGGPTRAQLLYALLEAGELCVCDLAATVAVSEAAVSHAMRYLRTAGVVRNRRQGRKIFYRLDDAHVRLLLELSREHVRHGQR